MDPQHGTCFMLPIGRLEFLNFYSFGKFVHTCIRGFSLNKVYFVGFNL